MAVLLLKDELSMFNASLPVCGVAAGGIRLGTMMWGFPRVTVARLS